MSADHILIPVHDFSHGGTERIGFRLAGRWLEAGRRVTVLAGARDGPMEPQVPAGAAIDVLDPPRPRSTLSRFSLGEPMAQAAKRHRPDAVFLIGNFHFILARALHRALPDAAIVGKVSNPLVPASLGHGWLARSIAAGWSAGLDSFVAMSNPSNRDLAPLVPGRNVTTIPDPFLDDDIVIAPRSGAPGDRIKLLFVGRFEPQKDPMLALAVAEELRGQGVDFHLDMLGSGALTSQVADALDRRGLRDCVSLAGNVSDTERYYRQADLLLMTSRFEGVPAVIGEALARGLPFVATACSPWVEDIAGGCAACGTVTHSRNAGAIADAILARRSTPYPSGREIEQAIGAHRLRISADAYLDLFDRIHDRKRRL